jgi:hypothetical protein
MKLTRWLTVPVLALPLLVAGCQDSPTGKPQASAAASKKQEVAAKAPAPDAKDDEKADEATIQKNLAKLSPEDRKAAEAQKYCVIEEEDRLGAMGAPVKITVKGQPVFLCCKNCIKQAEKDPDKTLAKLKELKEKAAKTATN